MVKKEIIRFEIRLPEKIGKDAQKHTKEYGYLNLQDLAREAIREKIYGKNIKEQITNEFMQQIEKEKEYIFKEKKDLHEKLKKIAEKF